MTSEQPAHYVIKRERYMGAVRWKLYRAHDDGAQTALGHYPTRKQARTTGGILAGIRGTVRIEKERAP